MRSQELGHAQKYNKLIKITAAGTLAALGFFGLAGCSSAEGSVHESVNCSDPATSDTNPACKTPTPSPSPSEKPKSYEEQVKELEIPAGLSAQDWAKQYADRWSDWSGTAGKSEELYHETMAAPTGDWSRVIKIADDNKKLYTDALYVPNWQQIPSLVSSAEKNRDANLGDVETWIQNHNGSGPDVEFEDTTKLQTAELISSTNGSRVIEATFLQRTNNDKVQFPNPGTLPGSEGEVFTITITTQTIDGTERVSNWQ